MYLTSSRYAQVRAYTKARIFFATLAAGSMHMDDTYEWLDTEMDRPWSGKACLFCQQIFAASVLEPKTLTLTYVQIRQRGQPYAKNNNESMQVQVELCPECCLKTRWRTVFRQREVYLAVFRNPRLLLAYWDYLKRQEKP